MNPLILNLGESTLFKGYTIGELERVFSSIHYRMEKYPSGCLVRSRGSVHDELLILLDGSAVAEMQDQSGKVIRVEKLEAPAVLGSAFLFSSDQEFPVDLVADVNGSTFLLMSRESVLRLCRDEEKFLSNLLRDIGDRINLLADKLFMLTLGTIKQRLANYLLKLHRSNGKCFELDMTREALADFFGVARPSLSRVFSELVDTGAITTKGRRVEIISVEKLVSILNLGR